MEEDKWGSYRMRSALIVLILVRFFALKAIRYLDFVRIEAMPAHL